MDGEEKFWGFRNFGASTGRMMPQPRQHRRSIHPSRHRTRFRGRPCLRQRDRAATCRPARSFRRSRPPRTHSGTGRAHRLSLAFDESTSACRLAEQYGPLRCCTAICRLASLQRAAVAHRSCRAQWSIRGAHGAPLLIGSLVDRWLLACEGELRATARQRRRCADGRCWLRLRMLRRTNPCPTAGLWAILHERSGRFDRRCCRLERALGRCAICHALRARGFGRSGRSSRQALVG